MTVTALCDAAATSTSALVAAKESGYSGVLQQLKLPHPHSLASQPAVPPSGSSRGRRVEACGGVGATYGFRRDRRSLIVERLRLQPEGRAGGSASGGMVPSGSDGNSTRPPLRPGMACAAALGPGTSTAASLDF